MEHWCKFMREHVNEARNMLELSLHILHIDKALWQDRSGFDILKSQIINPSNSSSIFNLNFNPEKGRKLHAALSAIPIEERGKVFEYQNIKEICYVEALFGKPQRLVFRNPMVPYPHTPIVQHPQSVQTTVNAASPLIQEAPDALLEIKQQYLIKIEEVKSILSVSDDDLVMEHWCRFMREHVTEAKNMLELSLHILHINKALWQDSSGFDILKSQTINSSNSFSIFNLNSSPEKGRKLHAALSAIPIEERGKAKENPHIKEICNEEYSWGKPQRFVFK